jgi:hypothetical protein
MPVARFFLQFLIFLLQSALFAWATFLPIVWIVRDGLGPDSHETGWVVGICKTLAVWGIPALVLAVSLYGLTRVERRMASWKRQGEAA